MTSSPLVPSTAQRLFPRDDASSRCEWWCRSSPERKRMFQCCHIDSIINNAPRNGHWLFPTTPRSASASAGPRCMPTSAAACALRRRGPSHSDGMPPRIRTLRSGARSPIREKPRNGPPLGVPVLESAITLIDAIASTIAARSCEWRTRQRREVGGAALDRQLDVDVFAATPCMCAGGRASRSAVRQPGQSMLRCRRPRCSLRSPPRASRKPAAHRHL